MRNREPTQPNRFTLTREDGTTETVFIVRNDVPTDEGTPLNKETLLSDQTETALFGNAADRTVNDAFYVIASQLKLLADDVASLTLTVQDEAGKGVAGVYVDGVLDETGVSAKTNASGVINGYVSCGNITLAVKNYFDIEDFSQAFTFTKGQSYTQTITVRTRSFLKLTSSKSGRFSENVSRLDAAVGGAGGGAGGIDYYRTRYDCASGGAGGGGYVAHQENVLFESNQTYSAVIGAGGSAGINNSGDGSDGGASSFVGLSAPGGKGGTGATVGSMSATPGVGGVGNGNGANGVWSNVSPNSGGRSGLNGENGTGFVFSSFSQTAPHGGGGGSGAANYGSAGVGGSPGGGSGGYATAGSASNGSSGVSNTGGGGGSGGVSNAMDKGTNFGTNGSGANGIVTMRMHLKTA